MWKKLLILLTGATLWSGCSWVNDYHATKYYDLQSPESYPALKANVQVGTFLNNTAVRQKLLFRDENGEIVQDEYNKYIQPPDSLLVRYLLTAFGNQPLAGDKAVNFNVYGRIFMFEFDSAALEARLGVEYTIELIKPGELPQVYATHSAVYRATSMSAEPAVVVRAMSRCAAQLSDQIYSDIEQNKN